MTTQRPALTAASVALGTGTNHNETMVSGFPPLGGNDNETVVRLAPPVRSGMSENHNETVVRLAARR